jgi:restriction system protein
MRDGAPAIDLLDGQERAELLKRYELGVKTVVVEKVVVDGEWFGGFERMNCPSFGDIRR